MSDKYKHGDTVPSDELCKRLHELSDAVTKGPQAVAREFGMRIPAELDRDADLVLSQAAIRLATLEAQLAERGEPVAYILETDDGSVFYGPYPLPEAGLGYEPKTLTPLYRHPPSAVPEGWIELGRVAGEGVTWNKNGNPHQQPAGTVIYAAPQGGGENE